MTAQTIKQVRILVEGLVKLGVPASALAGVNEFADKEAKKLATPGKAEEPQSGTVESQPPPAAPSAPSPVITDTPADVPVVPVAAPADLPKKRQKKDANR